MIHTAVVLAALAAAAPAPKATTLKVLVLDLRLDGAPDATARLVRDEMTVDLGQDARLDVLSSEDLRRVVDVDAQKRAIGCNEESCLAELGQALGARYIVHGSIGVLGSTTVVHVNLFDSEDGRAIARETAESRDIDELLPQVRAAVGRVRARMLGAPAPSEGSGPSTLTLAGGATAGVGAVIALVGGALMGANWGTFSSTTAPSAGGPKVSERQAAQTYGETGTVLLGGGAAVAVVGGGLLVFGVLE